MIPTKNSTGLRMATTPKILKALEVVESPVDPNLELPIKLRDKPMAVQVQTKASP